MNKPDISALRVCPNCGSMPSPDWIRGSYGWVCGSYFHAGATAEKPVDYAGEDITQSITCAVTPYRQRAEKAEAELLKLRKAEVAELVAVSVFGPLEFAMRWQEAEPAVLQIIREVQLRDPYKVTDRWAWQQKLSLAILNIRDKLRAEGLQMFESLPDVPMDYNEEDILALVRQAARYASCADETLRASVCNDTFRLLRIDAPAWFKHPGFLAWLNARGTATWHTGEDHPHEYSDAFFTLGDRAGSDYPGTKERPGIPQEIWEHLEFVAAEQFGWEADVLIWVRNL
jgi:hypothetical protein